LLINNYWALKNANRGKNGLLILGYKKTQYCKNCEGMD